MSDIKRWKGCSRCKRRWLEEDGVDGARRKIRGWYIESKRLLRCWLVGDRRRGGWRGSELLGHGQEGAERRS
jgi:hypothetical protein